MRAIRVLLIENSRSMSNASFAGSLKRKYQLHVAHSGKQASEIAASVRPDVVIVDAASLQSSGDRICAKLRAELGEVPIIHIRPAELPPGDSPADIQLSPPFTPRKLINRIQRFVAAALEGEVIEAGPFCLNLEQQTLTTPWIEKKLTPKLLAMMELFMKNPNQTLERRYLMQKIWQTDYMGDTRTLDVHIRWIREIIEPNIRKPRYIKTVRGKGYCLSISDSTEDEISNDEKSIEGGDER
jgi:DNA-binding response OmpR family regulator